jgi:hypothetical protein
MSGKYRYASQASSDTTNRCRLIAGPVIGPVALSSVQAAGAPCLKKPEELKDQIMKRAFAVMALAAALAGAVFGFQTIPFQITTASVLPNATVGTPYSVAIAASGGAGQYLWLQSSPGLPDGLGMNAGTGAITGIPGAAGTYTFVLSVFDSSGSPLDGGLITGAAQAQKQFTIIVQ